MGMGARTGPIAILVLGWLAEGCSRPRLDPQTHPDAAVAMVNPAPPRRREGARPIDAGRSGAIDPDAGTTYARALARGRAATQRKDYSGAIAAFDQAIAAVPAEPRSLAERGYAKLLAGDIRGAQADLEAAEGKSTDADLASQIWFNLGLVAEKKGDPGAAHSAFAHAYTLRPTNASRAKLGDAGSACTATIDTARTKLRHYATLPDSWESPGKDCEVACVVRQLPPEDAGEESPATDVADAPVPYHLVLPAPGGGYDVLESVAVGSNPPMRCGQGTAWLEIVDRAEPLHLRVVHLVSAGTRFQYGPPDDAGDRPVLGWECAAEGSESRLTDVLVERTRHERVLLVTQDVTNGVAAVVAKKGRGATLAGAGCDERPTWGPE